MLKVLDGRVYQPLIQELQETHPLADSDAGHFLCMVLLKDGTVYSCHGIVTDLSDLQERVFTPAAAHIQSRLKRTGDEPEPLRFGPVNAHNRLWTLPSERVEVSFTAGPITDPEFYRVPCERIGDEPV